MGEIVLIKNTGSKFIVHFAKKKQNYCSACSMFLSACQICKFVTCEVTETKNRNQGQSCDVKPNTISLFLSVLSENAWLKTAASIDNTHAFPCDIVDEQTTRVSMDRKFWLL